MKIIIVIDDPFVDDQLVNFYLRYMYNPKDLLVLTKVIVELYAPVHDSNPNDPSIKKEDDELATEADFMKALQYLISNISIDRKVNIISKLLEPGYQDVGECILNYTQEIKADMIIISAKRQNIIMRLFSGNAAYYLYRTSKIPITICAYDD
ncbi:hypothetical protein HZS_1039 [Henneguya salminicola]|nr:hypothetical protein HZS_1039 [Henneguya salminicola]